MKKIYLSVFALLAGLAGYGQTSIGVHGGTTRSHTDATPSKNGAEFGIDGQYAPVRYIALRASLTSGKVSGGTQSEKSLMSYANNYFVADLGFRFYPLALIKNSSSSGLSYFSKIYGGLGVGMLKNNTEINQMSSQSFSFIEDYKGTDVVFPAEFGVELPLGRLASSPKFNLNLYYRFNFLTTDKMDGYVPNLSSNKSNDAFSSFGLGLSYNFGGKKAVRKEAEEMPNLAD